MLINLKLSIIITVVFIVFLVSFRFVYAEENFSYKYHVVERGDSLWSIAEKYYGDGFSWKIILTENNISRNNHGIPRIYKGNILRIPIMEKQITEEVIEAKKGSNIMIVPYKYPPGLEKFASFLDNEITVSPLHQFRQEFIGPIWSRNSKGDGQNFGNLPMSAYLEATHQKSNYIDSCDSLSGPYKTDTSPHREDRDDLISECYESFDKKSYSFKLKKQNIVDSERFLVVINNKPGKLYQIVDQLIYNPSKDSLIYRARKNDKWYIIENKKERGPYEYVHTSFYTSDGNLYSLVKLNNDRWAILKNFKYSIEYDYIDEISYTKDAKNFVYRVKNKNKEGKEFWFIVYGNKKTGEWNYLDKYLNHAESGNLFYRARDDNGNWYIVRMYPDGKEEIIFKADFGSQPIDYYIDPNHLSNVFVKLEDEHGRQYMDKNQAALNRNYENIDLMDFIISPNGKHFVFHANDGYDNYYVVIDNKIIKKIGGCCNNNGLCYQELKFDKNNNFIIYNRINNKCNNETGESEGNIVREVIRLE